MGETSSGERSHVCLPQLFECEPLQAPRAERFPRRRLWAIYLDIRGGRGDDLTREKLAHVGEPIRRARRELGHVSVLRLGRVFCHRRFTEVDGGFEKCTREGERGAGNGGTIVDRQLTPRQVHRKEQSRTAAGSSQTGSETPPALLAHSYEARRGFREVAQEQERDTRYREHLLLSGRAERDVARYEE
jgi:hypothetical protein